MPDHARLPADAGLDYEIAPIGAIAQDLHMLDVGDAGNLGGGVLQQARDGGRFIDNSRERRECTLIVQSFLWIEHWSASYRRSTCGPRPSSRIVRPPGRRCASELA